MDVTSEGLGVSCDSAGKLRIWQTDNGEVRVSHLFLCPAFTLNELSSILCHALNELSPGLSYALFSMSFHLFFVPALNVLSSTTLPPISTFRADKSKAQPSA